jgi:hypothetical protein
MTVKYWSTAFEDPLPASPAVVCSPRSRMPPFHHKIFDRAWINPLLMGESSMSKAPRYRVHISTIFSTNFGNGKRSFFHGAKPTQQKETNTIHP